jgi:hypothetical protein
VADAVDAAVEVVQTAGSEMAVSYVVAEPHRAQLSTRYDPVLT